MRKKRKQARILIEYIYIYIHHSIQLQIQNRAFQNLRPRISTSLKAHLIPQCCTMIPKQRPCLPPHLTHPFHFHQATPTSGLRWHSHSGPCPCGPCSGTPQTAQRAHKQQEKEVEGLTGAQRRLSEFQTLFHCL